MVIRLIVLIFVLLSGSAHALTQLSATVDKNPVMMNESLILTITADEKLSRNALDFSVLNNDFQVVRENSSWQTQIINSDVSNTTTWSVILIARKEGRFTIPAFNINNVASNPIPVEVIAMSQAPTGKAQEVFLETSVDKTSAYLQSSITYTSKLYLSLDFQRGSLTEPKMDNANITQISDKQDAESSEIRNGVRYRVITRVYSITPQRSGKYTIEPPLFNGELVVKRQRSFFSGFNNTKPVSVLGNQIEIEVLPIPQDYAGQWLPSEKVVLSEEWQPNDNNYTVGDPITRIITLSAIGVNEEQLPEINVTYPANVKTYPDQSTLHSATRNNRLIAQRKDSLAIVPGEPGPLTLPEVKIPWFNTISNQMEYATLPAKTVNILSGSATPVAAIPNAAPATANRTLPPQVVTEIKEVPVNNWMTWTFLGAWLLTILMWLLHVRMLKSSAAAATQSQNQGPVATSGRTYWTLFEKACKNNDAATAASELMRWARARWPEQSFNSTMEIALFLGAQEVIDAVKPLQQALYSAKGSNWQGNTLLQAVAQNKNPKAEKSSQALNPLHPG